VIGVHLTVVGDETEATIVCGWLREAGIKCSYRRTDMAAAYGTYGGGYSMAGPTEILVDPDDLERAQELLKANERPTEVVEAGLRQNTCPVCHTDTLL
jgi:hypothetical protein